MKKLSIICAFALVFGLMAGPAFATSYCKDYLEPGNPGGPLPDSWKSFDEEFFVTPCEEFMVDIWINGCPAGASLGGFWAAYTGPITLIEVLRYNNDVAGGNEWPPGSNGLAGPWTPGGANINEPMGTPNAQMVVVPNLGTAPPDSDGDIIIARMKFHCEGAGVANLTISTIPATGTWAPAPPWDDALIPPNTLKICQVVECLDDADCLDDLYCNGEEYCAPAVDMCGFTGKVCYPGTSPCPPPTDCIQCWENTPNDGTGGCFVPAGITCTDDSDVCTDDICDGAGTCTHPFNTASCNDGISCTVNDICDSGDCHGTPIHAMCDDSNVCTDDVCDPALDCQNTPNTEPCDDGIYCNGLDTCAGGDCVVHAGDPCDDGNPCTDDTCIEDDPGSCTNVCNATSITDPCCEDPACENEPVCIARGLIKIGKGWYNSSIPGSDRILGVGVKVPICLENLTDEVGGVSLDLCEWISGRGKVDCLECVGCEMTERTQMFSCMVNELQASDPNPDCCALVVFATHPGGVINPGECDIVTIDYKFKDTRSYCTGEEGCIEIYAAPGSVVVADQYGVVIPSAVFEDGEVCPFSCGDVYPDDDGVTPYWDCGDGVVDIMDIVEEVDYILRKDYPDACQVGTRSDVPTGTPPPVGEKCIAPDGNIDILDLMVIIDMVLERPNCCDYEYGGVVY